MGLRSNYELEDLVECKRCTKIMNQPIRHLPPECSVKERLSKTIPSFEVWPGMEELRERG